MRTLNITLLILALLNTVSFAQQDPQYTQYMFNMLAINPAYAGSRDVLSMTALYRNQWAGNFGPKTMTFSADMPLIREKIGVGIMATSDQQPKIDNNNIAGYLSYRMKLHKRGTLAFGASLGANFYNTRFSEVQQSTAQGGGASTDPSFQNNLSKILPVIGAGLYYSTDRFYVGFSAPSLLGSTTNNTIDSVQSAAKKYQHLFLTGGYVINLSEELKLKPSAILKWVSGSPTQMDLNANLWFYDKFAVGISYRSLSSLAILLEWQINDQWRVGYAYDFPLNETRNISYFTHELMLRYEVGFRSKKFVTPRYF
ncbi:MAG: type IX secretion system membrane protein PorP/SprF [Cytophagales bacterium]|nr:type IX secretion system membrane protein PorP/SprF [Cytophagales bacterium]